MSAVYESIGRNPREDGLGKISGLPFDRATKSGRRIAAQSMRDDRDKKSDAGRFKFASSRGQNVLIDRLGRIAAYIDKTSSMMKNYCAKSPKMYRVLQKGEPRTVVFTMTSFCAIGRKVSHASPLLLSALHFVNHRER